MKRLNWAFKIFPSYTDLLLGLKTSVEKEKSKQNTTRDIEVGNSLAVARGEWGGDSGKRGLQELL